MIKTVFDIKIDFDKSFGSYLFDKKSNKRYLDLFSMFSSLPLGYNHQIFDNDFNNEVKKVANIKMSNNFCESDELINFKKIFSSIVKNKNIHFCSTGALAVESAIKCAFESKKNPNHKVISIKNNYHGINSWGFTTDPTMPAVANRVVNFPKNDWLHMEIDDIPKYIESFSNDITAIIIEPIQCTAGDIYLDIKKLKNIEIICKEKNICFICDEIQTGFGVTGSYWYSDNINLDPDILIFGKKSQIFGISTNDKYSEAILSKFRKLEVTFDGDLIDAIRSEYIIKAIKKFNLLEKVKENSAYFKESLSVIFKNYRTCGHLIAFDFESKIERDHFFRRAIENNLLINPTGEKSIRMRPNLAISNIEIDNAIEILKRLKKN